MSIADDFRLAAQATIAKFSIGPCSIVKYTKTYSTTTGTTTFTSNSTVSVPHVIDSNTYKYEKNKNFIGATAAVLVAGLDMGSSKALAEIGNRINIGGVYWNIAAKEVDMYEALFILGVAKV